MDVGSALLIGLLAISLGIFFVGVAALWWVSLVAREIGERRGPDDHG